MLRYKSLEVQIYRQVNTKGNEPCGTIWSIGRKTLDNLFKKVLRQLASINHSHLHFLKKWLLVGSSPKKILNWTD